MKKLITICLLVAATFTVKAQDITFEETVKYVNEIFSENQIPFWAPGMNTAYFVTKISVNKDGKVIMYDAVDKKISSINLFDIDSWDYSSSTIDLKTKDKSKIGELRIIPAVGKRLEKALTYLRSFCSKKSDPFAN